MIKLEKVSKFYASGDNNVSLGLHNVSLEMKKGEIIGIVGESGSGKSTFLNVCSLLDTYEEGEIYYDGIPVSSFTPEEIDEFRKNHIGFIFQNYNLIDSYTVLQNVLMPLIIKGVNLKEAKIKAKEIIKKVGLEHRMNHKGTRLSGGEKQRCVIARALASDSEILACDEPTGNLDSKTGREIIELIKEVARDKLVLIVTHNYEELSDIITRRLTFADGNLIEDTKLKNKQDCSDELLPKSEYKFSFKERLRLSIKDIFSTPKKSILTFIIFLAISAFIAYLYTGLITYRNSYADDGIFQNVVSDRFVIYETGKKFNYSDFDGLDINHYANFEDQLIFFKTDTVDREAAYFRFSMPNVKLKKGTFPKNDNEVILGVPENGISSCYKETVTFDLRFGAAATGKYDKYNDLMELTESGYKAKEFKVVGYYTLSDSTIRDYIVTGTSNFTQMVTNSLINKTLINYSDSRIDCYLTDDFYIRNRLVDDNLADNVIKLTLPSSYEEVFNDIENNLLLKYNDVILDKTGLTFDISYELTTFNSSMSANMNTYRRYAYLFDNYLSIYETDQVKIDNLINKISNLGYSICNAKEAYVIEDLSFSSILNTILYAFYIVGVIFAFVIVFFISYFILARIYAIKNKDYTVFRTLGMSKKDMASLVRIQTVILSLSTAILVLIAVGISYIFNYPIIGGFHRIGILGIIVYLIFMYSLFFAIRFNRKLYKFSVSKTFRGGVLGND